MNTDMGFSKKDERDLIRFFADSAEQIARSMEMLGLQNHLLNAFEVAIATARRSQQGPAQAAIKGTTVDPKPAVISPIP